MKTQSKNPCAKTRDVNDPYEVYRGTVNMMGDILHMEWRVLKKYQTPEKEAENQYARWFCAVKSEATFGSYDMGDTYVSDILGRKVYDYQTNNPTELEQW